MAAGKRTRLTLDCPDCGGNGFIGHEGKLCLRCEATGLLLDNACPQCHGNGYVQCGCTDTTCTTCVGTGIARESHKRPRAAAPEILVSAADAIDNRASQRDHHSGERSMFRTIAAFNALTGHQLSELDGWVLMAILKFARGRGGKPVLDDYLDAAAYAALAGECAMGDRSD